MKIVHFTSGADFRHWLEANHATAPELFVGFYKKKSGRGGITYQEAIDEALCFGWIDGVIKSLDVESYAHRFTPRRAGSIWSNLNVAHVARLMAAGKMQAAGMSAFSARTAAKTGIYSFEKNLREQPEKFPAKFVKTFRSDKTAWRHWQSSPPGYQRKLLHWVVSAKQETTRQSRLAKLIAAHAAAKRFE